MPSDMEPGQVFAGRYRLDEPLASGGMGTVWRGHHLELDSPVAVKLLSKELLSTTSVLGRFRREARAAARLRSPHIVQVFDFGVEEEQPFLVMELLQGEDLAARIQRRGYLSASEVLPIVAAVCKALMLAHAEGIVHRDLKPANIFLERIGADEIVKVLDFGIAKDLAAAPDGAQTTGGGMIGSPAYMSPEQITGKKVGPLTDVWSLGVVVFEMLAGRSPFHAASLGEIFIGIGTRDPPPMSSIRPDLPKAIDDFFRRALAKDEVYRMASVRELHEALASALCAPIEPREEPFGARAAISPLAATAPASPTGGQTARVDLPENVASHAPAASTIGGGLSSRTVVPAGSGEFGATTGAEKRRSRGVAAIAIAVLVLSVGGVGVAALLLLHDPFGDGMSELSTPTTVPEAPVAEAASNEAPVVSASGEAPAPSAVVSAAPLPASSTADALPSASANPPQLGAPIVPPPPPPPPPQPASVPPKPSAAPAPLDPIFGVPVSP